jgi:hypothetical protein
VADLAQYQPQCNGPGPHLGVSRFDLEKAIKHFNDMAGEDCKVNPDSFFYGRGNVIVSGLATRREPQVAKCGMVGRAVQWIYDHCEHLKDGRNQWVEVRGGSHEAFDNPDLIVHVQPFHVIMV